MTTSTSRRFSSSTLRVVTTTRRDGDLNADRIPAAELERRYAGLAPYPVTWLDEAHGGAVVVVGTPGEHRGAVADAAVTCCPGAALSVWVGDCAPLVLWAEGEAVLGVAHAGWRALEAGIVDASVATMRSLGASHIAAAVGPCIHAECYEFGEAELTRLARRFGPSVRSRTGWGTSALDLPAAVRAACGAVGIGCTLGERAGDCTACHPERYWSHRARSETGRHGVVAWIEP